LQYITPNLARNIIADANVAPLSKFGQNFMVDSGQVQKIVQLANIKPGEFVLEIGPGLGSLTVGLLAAGAKVVAVEIDTGLAKLLPQTIEQLAPEYAGQLNVLQADALELTADEVISAFKNLGNDDIPDLKLVSNLPYNVATPILLTLLQRIPSISNALVLVQAEVANRLAAQPNNKTYGIPSVKMGWYGTTVESSQIPRSSFWPVPRVDSKLVQFTRYADRPAWQIDTNCEDVFSLINLAFSSRRKSLKSLLVHDGYSSDSVVNHLDSLQIDPLARGETLNTRQFAELTKLLKR
jgi:16S rRNA (adenine1518-N6/adenine1519-N6)-dimethyltransferase